MGVVGAVCLASSSYAVKVSNSFVTVEGEGVGILDDGSITHDENSTDDITVTARPGWRVNGQRSVTITPARGSRQPLGATSDLHEDQTHVHVFPSSVSDEHVPDTYMEVSAEANPASDIKMYALPDTSTVVTVSATKKLVKTASHRKVTRYYKCACGANRKFLLHGHEVSSSLRDGEIKIEHIVSGAVDIAKYTDVKFDIKATCDSLPGSGKFGKNPEVFKGPCLDFGTPDAVPPRWWLPGTKENPSSQALNVFFKYIKDESDEPGDFTVKFDADLRPAALLSICKLEWTQTDGPATVPLTNIDKGHAELQNPPATGGKSASVYKYRLTASNDDFELKSEAWVMLPRAGGEISGWLEAEVPRMINKAEAWTNAVMNAYPPDRPLEEAKGFVLTKAWMYIASNEFDYQGVAGDPTPRYSYADEDRKGVGPDVIGGRYGNGDFDEPSYATLKGIVVYRAKINNMMYCVWGRTIGYSTFELQLGAHWNSWRRNQVLDNTTSQLSIQIGGALYDACIKKQSLGHLITKEKAKLLRSNGELDDVNLWPNDKIAPMGFSFPEMPTDYNTLSQGDQSGET